MIVGNDGVGRSDAARLANPDADPGEEELHEIGCQTADSRETTPDQERSGHDPGPVDPIGKPGDRHAQR